VQKGLCSYGSNHVCITSSYKGEGSVLSGLCYCNLITVTFLCNDKPLSLLRKFRSHFLLRGITNGGNLLLDSSLTTKMTLSAKRLCYYWKDTLQSYLSCYWGNTHYLHMSLFRKQLFHCLVREPLSTGHYSALLTAKKPLFIKYSFLLLDNHELPCMLRLLCYY
jgi:hypothetical protein